MSLRSNWISSSRMRLHLEKVECYFPELSQEQETMVRNPFCMELDVSSIPNNIQDEFLDLMNDVSARDLFKVKCVTQSYTKVSMIDYVSLFHLLLPTCVRQGSPLLSI